MNFLDTVAGNKFATHDVPELIKALNNLNSNVVELNKNLVGFDPNGEKALIGIYKSIPTGCVEDNPDGCPNQNCCKVCWQGEPPI